MANNVRAYGYIVPSSLFSFGADVPVPQQITGFAGITIDRVANVGLARWPVVGLDDYFSGGFAVCSDGDSAGVVFILCDAVDPGCLFAAAARYDAVDGQCRVFRDDLGFLYVEFALAVKGLAAFRGEEQSSEFVIGLREWAERGNEQERAEQAG